MKNKFSWEYFEPEFLKEVLLSSPYAEKFEKRIENGSDDPCALSAMMSKVCRIPDERFVRFYREKIEYFQFPVEQEEVKNICKILGIQESSHNQRLDTLRDLPLSASLIAEYQTALINIGGIEKQHTEYNRFRYTVERKLNTKDIPEVNLYSFQKAAVEALKKHFVDEDQERGLLVLPTGAGKTLTSTYFLVNEMVSRGYIVVWIAHRHMLINQAAYSFLNLSPLLKKINPESESFQISCISGEHLRCNEVPRGNNVIIGTVQSVSRNLEMMEEIIKEKDSEKNPDLMLVIDESHHTFAKSYRNTIKGLRKACRKFKMLGLTATPVRTNEDDSIALRTLFDNNIVYNVAMSNLIAQDILANPIPEKFKSGVRYEQKFTAREKAEIRRNGELPESVMTRLAVSRKRNNAIVKAYLNNQTIYGKTLIFALNKIHCVTLTEELKDKGVKCNCVYAGKPDNDSVIEDFKKGVYDVLVNVNIMTEGTDVPDIETVFLTRPTQSESFLMQMIGRGMRGVRSGGTKNVHIVYIEDTWEIFTNWLNPQFILDIEREIEDKEIIKKEYEYTFYEWKAVIEAYKAMSAEDVDLELYKAFPHGWFTVQDENDEDYRILVFDDQMRGFERMLYDGNMYTWIDNNDFTAFNALIKYFSYFCNHPRQRDVDLLMQYCRENGELPPFYSIKEKDEVDPVTVAAKAPGEDFSSINAYAREIYDGSQVLKDLYDTVEDYQFAVCTAKANNGNPLKTHGLIEEIPIESIPYDKTPCYDLEELTAEVDKEMFGGKYGEVHIVWSPVYMKDRFGQYDPNNGIITINKILNSKSVPREVTKYIIYHEMLHRDNHTHNDAFRAEEHKFDKWKKWDNFLDAESGKFDIREW